MKTSNTIQVTIQGFNKTSFGIRLNTVPTIPVWVNSLVEYKHYEKLVGKQAEFIRRNITTTKGEARTVYDLNRTKIDEEELVSAFAKSFAAKDKQDENTEDAPEF